MGRREGWGGEREGEGGGVRGREGEGGGGRGSARAYSTDYVISMRSA